LKTYNKTNFHKHTFCIFKEVKIESFINLKPNFISKSGSSYYFTEQGVYRHSNHWGRAANCKWRLVSNGISKDRTKIGYASWSDFYPDNDQEKLYFIEVDYSDQSAQFNHCKSDKYKPGKVLRTAAETTKLIKQIRGLLEENAWAKYLKHESIEVLRKEIIDQLIATSCTLQEIKKEYL
jgi:hypothetical protein